MADQGLEILHTLTPDAKAPSNTAFADDISFELGLSIYSSTVNWKNSPTSYTLKLHSPLKKSNKNVLQI